MRIVATVAAALGASVLGMVVLLFKAGNNLAAAAPFVFPVPAAIYVWNHFLSGQAGTSLLMSAVRGAVLTGGVGFALGFLGPMIVAPGANQGPLLGIFITGPLGFVLGAVGGIVRWYQRRTDVD